MEIKKIRIYLLGFAAIALLSMPSCKVFKKKCDCPKWTKAKSATIPAKEKS